MEVEKDTEEELEEQIKEEHDQEEKEQNILRKEIKVSEREGQLLNSITEAIFSNLKIFIEERLRELEPLFIEQIDLRNNVATLSSLLASKKLFTAEEYKSTYNDIIDSFGVVKPDGTMDGEVEMVLYNLE